MSKSEKLEKFENLVKEGMDASGVRNVFSMIGAPDMNEEDISNMRVYPDHLPMGKEDPYTPEQRFLHILWETMDKVPLGIDASFAIPYRQIIAQKLFKKCGKAFIAVDHCKFNYGHHIEVGDFVAWNSGVFIDSKGGVKFGDHSMCAENITIFTHAHSESNHLQRIYKSVEVKPHAILGAGCTVMGGVTVGTGAFVGACSVVTQDVPDNIVVAGAPAKTIRKTKREGKSLEEVNHYFLEKDSFLR